MAETPDYLDKIKKEEQHKSRVEQMARRREEARKSAAKRVAAAKRAAAKTARTGTQAKRKASRSPGGFAGGGAIESYSAQVQRKYGGGKV